MEGAGFRTYLRRSAHLFGLNMALNVLNLPLEPFLFRVRNSSGEFSCT